MPKNTIYLSILLLIIGGFISLPLLKIPVSASVHGVVRSEFEDTPVTASVAGRVTQSYLLKNNQKITKGDTLLVLKEGQIIEKGNHQELLSKNTVYKTMWEKQSVSLS